MILDEDVERVREAADIVQVIGEHVKLKRVGTSWRGPCPFHGGTGPNFSVVPGKGFKCFVCGEGGDVFTFLQKHLGMDWPSAVRSVAEKTGIVLREVDTRRQEGPDPREPLWEANAAAAEFFQRMLWDDPAGAEAREYLATRDVSPELARRVALGYMPREAAPFIDHFRTLGIADQKLVEAGLLVQREGERPRPRFRSRLMFPILDSSGRHVGFGGRILGPGEPKYLNSPESPVFSKGRMVYGLNWARHAIRKADRVVLVEGYFDALRLIGAGIEETIAPMGTALTDAQAALLVRSTKNVFLLYDSDPAGLKATFRAGDELLRHGASVRVVTLPEGEDPDTFVRTQGREKLESQLAHAVDVFERKVQILDRAGWFTSLDRKRRALDRLIPTIQAASDRLTRDLYLGRAAEAAGVARDLLAKEVEGEEVLPEPASRLVRGPSRGTSGDPLRERRRRLVESYGSNDEYQLLRVLVNQPLFWKEITSQVSPGMFRVARHKDIFSALVAEGPGFGLEDVAVRLEASSVELLERFRGEADLIGNPRDVIVGCLERLRERESALQRSTLQDQFSVANETEKTELLRKITEAVREKQRVGGSRYNPFDDRKKPPLGGSGAS